MKAFSVDLSKFKKISTDGKKTVLRNDDGHEFRVAHAGINPTQRKQLEAIPHYDEGGSVDDESGKSPAQESVRGKVNGSVIPKRSMDAMESIKEQEGPVPGDPGYKKEEPSIWDKALDYGKTAYNAVDNALTLPGEKEEIAQKAQQRDLAAIPAPQPAVMAPAHETAPTSLAPQQPSSGTMLGDDPYGNKAYQDTYMSGMAQQKAGLQQEASAQGALGKQQAEIAHSEQDLLQNANQHYQQESKRLSDEYNSVINDVKQQHINPKHYMESQSSGQKVMNAIGMILSGFGSGLAHQENLAMKFLDGQINRDIEAQKANLGKSETLLSANLKQFGNLNDATNMTRAMGLGITAAKLQEAAGKSADPMAQARAQQAIGLANKESAAIIGSIAMKRGVMSSLGGVTDPAQKVRLMSMAGVIPKEETEHVYKELEEAQKLHKARDNVLSAFDKVAEINSPMNRIKNPIQSRSQISAIEEPLIAMLSKETAGRYTESDAKAIREAFKSIADSPATVATKRRQLEKITGEKMNFPKLKAYNIDPGLSSRFDSGGNSKIQMGAPVRQ